MKLKKLVAIGGFALLALVAAPSAFATAVLTMSDGTNSVTIVDQTGAGTTCSAGILAASCVDANASSNVVTFVGTIGTWSLNVSTGASHGTVVGTLMDLNSVNSTSAAGTLTITFTDDGFVNEPAGGLHVGGTMSGASGSLAFSGFGGATKGALTNQIGSTMTFTSSPFSGSTSGAVNNAAYTLKAVLTFTGAGATSFDLAMNPVPEPGSVMLLGSAFLLTAGVLRKKMKKA